MRQPRPSLAPLPLSQRNPRAVACVSPLPPWTRTRSLAALARLLLASENLGGRSQGVRPARAPGRHRHRELCDGGPRKALVSFRAYARLPMGERSSARFGGRYRSSRPWDGHRRPARTTASIRALARRLQAPDACLWRGGGPRPDRACAPCFCLGAVLSPTLNRLELDKDQGGNPDAEVARFRSSLRANWSCALARARWSDLRRRARTRPCGLRRGAGPPRRRSASGRTTPGPRRGCARSLSTSAGIRSPA